MAKWLEISPKIWTNKTTGTEQTSVVLPSAVIVIAAWLTEAVAIANFTSVTNEDPGATAKKHLPSASKPNWWEG